MNTPTATMTREAEGEKIIRFGRVGISTVLTEEEYFELKKWLREHRHGLPDQVGWQRLVMEWEELYDVQ